MNKSALSYAQHLFDIAKEVNQLEEVKDDLNSTLSALKEQPKFMELLMTPMVEDQVKKDFIQLSLSQEISKIVADFLVILVEEGNTSKLEEIGAVYRSLVNRYFEAFFGIVEGTVYSAVALTRGQLEQLTQVFENKLGKKVRFYSEIDHSLIGGYKVSIANNIYDSTIKLQLKQLRENLMNIELE